MNPHIARAQLLVQQQRFDLAERELAVALAEQPGDAQAYRLMARCLLGREKFDAATLAAQSAVSLEPDESLNHYSLANVWLTRKHMREATASIAEAIRLNPLDADCHSLLAAVHLSQKEWNEALAAANAALAIDGEHIGALNKRARALRSLGYKLDAVQELHTALAHDAEDARTHANLGWSYLHQNDSAAAERHFREALRLEPDHESARDGVLESIKSRSAFYRLILQYFLWMKTKKARKQWAIILGAYLAFQIAVMTVRYSPLWGWVLWPLVIAYIFFAISSWVAVPLSNLLIWLHPFGRLVLSRTEKLESSIIGITVLAVAITHIVGWMTGNSILITIACLLTFLGASIAMTVNSRVLQARRIMIAYTVLVALLVGGNLTTLWILACTSWPEEYPVLSQLHLIGIFAAGISGLGAILLANFLSMKNWKR